MTFNKKGSLIMAAYIDKDNVTNLTEYNIKSLEKFNAIRKQGEKPRFAGIYICQSCGFEEVITRECVALPRCSGCKEEQQTWKLLVCTGP